ncbi:unnamed protein product, partial [Larinioides sclopetarius]
MTGYEKSPDVSKVLFNIQALHRQCNGVIASAVSLTVVVLWSYFPLIRNIFLASAIRGLMVDDKMRISEISRHNQRVPPRASCYYEKETILNAAGNLQWITGDPRKRFTKLPKRYSEEKTLPSLFSLSPCFQFVREKNKMFKMSNVI